MKKETNILIVDDNFEIAEILTAYFEKENFDVSYAKDGEEALKNFYTKKFDAIILDWMMPGLTGLELIKEIRKNSKIPILMLSARDDEGDIVVGLEYGADDYMRKPFGSREVVARVKALLRRNYNLVQGKDEMKFDDVIVSFTKMEVKKAGKIVSLTPNEFNILKVLIDNEGSVVSRNKLMEDALGYDNSFYDRTLDTHIKNLRKKLEKDPTSPQFIKTIRTVGFKFLSAL